METVRLSDYSSYDKNKGGIQKLRHKFRNQILEYWGGRYRDPDRNNHGI